ncbi:MAG: GNAT family N-acetyltransferase [Gammaproteobacteria bacterium]|nr:GNAT family N-acetyltransferase [Gammaproteobacteria bacterium]
MAYEIRERSMRMYVEKTWGVWKEDEARNQIRDDITYRRLSIIEVDDQPIGMMRVDEHNTHFDIDQLFLLPHSQNQGIGTALIRSVLSRAKERGLPVKLWVLRVNPARNLYLRLGFKVVIETDESLHLQSGD